MIDRFLRWLTFRSVSLGDRVSTWAAHAAARWAQGRGNPHTFTTREELAQLFRLAFTIPPDTCMLEIGAYVGASARLLGLAAQVRKTTLVCVDTWNNETMPGGLRDTHAEFIQNTSAFASNIRMVRKRSDQLVQDDVPAPVGLAFIDGDHSYASCIRDFETVVPFLHPNAIVAFHDATSFAGVSRAIGENLATRRWCMAGNTQSLVWIRRAAWAHDL